MDLDEWEILPLNGFLDYHESEKKTLAGSKGCPNPKSVLNMNYFACPPSSPRNSRAVSDEIFPVEIQLGPPTSAKDTEAGLLKDVSEGSTDLSVVPSVIMPKVKDPKTGSKEADQDSVSQVFFRKMKENEFVDMKMDSPKSFTKVGFVPPQLDAGAFNFEDRIEAHEAEAVETKITSPRIKKETETVHEEEVPWEESSGGFDLWKWSLTGIGAICSFGVAAATICIIVFGSNQTNKQQKMRFQIYNDDKRIKEVVHHQAAKLNEAISAVRGVPINRAQITYGGYYDGL